MKKTKEKAKGKEKMLKTKKRLNKGITLIALVVTIVILLILAGVSISLVLDNNGIIGKSKDARLETRASQVEDEIGLWKQSNFIKKELNQAQESADTVLASLISRKLLTEDEIDRNQELITIKKNDGTVVKEISYSSVTINISKTPETEKSLKVLVKVESVDGLAITIKNKEELNNFVNSLSGEQKKEIIRNGYMEDVKQDDSSANCTTFQDVLDYFKNKGWIEEATEEAFWSEYETSEAIDVDVVVILRDYYYDESTNQIEGYTITNPDNETSNTYRATENGTYTFKVQDKITGKTYTKKVEVNNIDKSIPLYTIVGKTNSRGYVSIMLKSETTDEYTNFEKAYIMYNNEKVELTLWLYEDENNTPYCDASDLWAYLNIGHSEIENTDQTIILVKDNKEYIGIVNVGKQAEPS